MESFIKEHTKTRCNHPAYSTSAHFIASEGDIHGEQSRIILIYCLQQLSRSRPLPKGINTEHSPPATSLTSREESGHSVRKAREDGQPSKTKSSWPATLHVLVMNILGGPIQLAFNKFNINHVQLAKNKKGKNNILNSMDILLDKHTALDKMGEDCPFNQAEFLYAAHSVSISN